jgi:hypothetical protein
VVERTDATTLAVLSAVPIPGAVRHPRAGRTGSADAGPARRPQPPSNVLAVVTHTTYRAVLTRALACAGDRPPRLTVFTHVPHLLQRNCAWLLDQQYTQQDHAAEVRQVELAAHALLPSACSVCFVGAGPRPRHDLRTLVATIAPDAIVTGERDFVMRGWLRATARRHGAILLAA